MIGWAGKKYSGKTAIKSQAPWLRHMISNDGRISLYWSTYPDADGRPCRNWGDWANPELMQWLTGRGVCRAERADLDKLTAMGSVMESANEGTVIWGTGVIRPGDVGSSPPRRICSVRGPLTRSELLLAGIACPEIYGDPGLLWPRIQPFDGRVAHDVTIIPHYVEMDMPVVESMRKEGLNVLDPRAGTFEFPAQITRSRYVASSSLHGIVLADAYGVPNARIRLSDKLVGRHFKFVDYNLAVGKEPDFGFFVGDDTRFARLINLDWQLPGIDRTGEIIDSFPWDLL